MSVRRGPTERRRSEGTPTKEGPNQEQAPLVTWGAFPSNSPKAKPEAVRPTLLIYIQPLVRKRNTAKKRHRSCHFRPIKRKTLAAFLSSLPPNPLQAP
jgi:hypothetical protein